MKFINKRVTRSYAFSALFLPLTIRIKIKKSGLPWKVESASSVELARGRVTVLLKLQQTKQPSALLVAAPVWQPRQPEKRRLLAPTRSSLVPEDQRSG